MPQASPELRREFPGLDRQALHHLQAAGFRLTTRWQWIRPPDTTYELTQRDHDAIQYLVDEWDFGGLVP